MAVTLNALTTGVGGLQTTGDTSGAIQLQSNGTATLTIDTSGNVGINKVPNAWGSGFKALQISDSTSVWSNPSTTTSYYSNNIYYNGTNRIFISNGYATEYQQNTSGYHAWFLGGTGTAGGTVTLTEAMRIGPAGEIGIGSSGNYGTSGQFLKSNGSGAAATWGTAGGGFSNMTVFTSPGTFTTPASTTQIKVTVVGGGGGGGTLAPSNLASGGGGGGAAIYVGPVTASTPYAVTVGASVAANTAGNTSSFGALASATGGGPGVNTTGAYVSGGSGGSGSAGTLQMRGNPGSFDISGSIAWGGSSFFGGGGNGGSAGGQYGGGGGAGATGGAGVVVVEY